MLNRVAEARLKASSASPPPSARWLVLAHLEDVAGRLDPAPDAPPRNERARERRNPPASAPPALDAPPDQRLDLPAARPFG
jgi:hypothetical protein